MSINDFFERAMRNYENVTFDIFMEEEEQDLHTDMDMLRTIYVVRRELRQNSFLSELKLDDKDKENMNVILGQLIMMYHGMPEYHRFIGRCEQYGFDPVV